MGSPRRSQAVPSPTPLPIVRAICAELGIERLVTWGHSGGGPHALACAALLPDLVTAAAALASPAPYDVDGLDHFAGMDQDNVDDTRLFLTDKAAARKKLDKDRGDILAASPDEAAREIESTLTPTDAALQVGDGEFHEFFLSCTQNGLAPGSQGWWDDNCMLKPWGIRRRRHRRSGPAPVRRAGRVRADWPRRMAGSAHSRRRGPAARR